jgi:hypothetical protein
MGYVYVKELSLTLLVAALGLPCCATFRVLAG